MQPIGFPQHQRVLLQDLASRVLDHRAAGCDGETLARDLLAGFYDVCMRWGLDRVLADLEQAFPPLDLTDPLALADHPVLRGALVDKLAGRVAFDGGPRNAQPRLLADCLIAALALTMVEEPDRTITLADEVRVAVTAALAAVIDVDFAIPRIRDTVIAKARAQCEERFHGAFERITAQLDDRGMRMIRQPKVPLDAVQAVQRVLFEARNAVVEEAAQVAIDRARDALARVDADAAARIDRPITLRLTPRMVAIERAKDARVPKVATSVVLSLVESLAELAHLAWRPLERPVRTYAANQTFAVGDLVDHPKFGRGSVLSTAVQRIEVEFADGKHTLVHVGVHK